MPIELVFARQERPAGLSTLEQVRALQEQAAASASTAAADAVTEAMPRIETAISDAASQAAQDAAAQVAPAAADAIRAQVAADADRVQSAVTEAGKVVQDVQVETMPVVLPVAPAEPLVVTSDGYQMIRREGDSLFLGDAQFVIDGVTGDLRITTPDGYSLLSFDPQTGAIRGVIAPDHLTITGGLKLINGTPCPGTVTKVRRSGEFFGYDLHSPDYTGPVIGRVTGDWAAPHFADSPVIDVIEADGQSWQTIADYIPAEIDFEDATGETAVAVRDLLTPMVLAIRKANTIGVVQPQDSIAALDDTISNGLLPGEFFPFVPRLGFSTARMAAVARSRHQRRMGLPCNPTVVQHVGWPGQSSDKFLPGGSSFTYVDSAGVTQTVPAALVAGATEYLWARNIAYRQAVANFVSARYLNRTLRHRFVTWIQGGVDDVAGHLAFAAKYRAEQDALAIPGHTGPRDILWDQAAGTTRQTVRTFASQGQVEFAQANASGHDWLVGPRYPYKMRDYIHHSSFGALGYAEVTGQAMAYIEKYGQWQPLWVTNVAVSGDTVTLTTNRPRQAVGDLMIDTTGIPAQPNHGFSLWDVTANAAIPITSVVVSENTIVINAGATLSGTVEVGYAARAAVTPPDGTVNTPQFSALVGNIKMRGRDAPTVIPASVMPTLDAWLCAMRKIITV